MKRQGKNLMLVGLALGALAIPGAAIAGSTPSAHTSSEGQSRYITKGKLKAAKKIKYSVVCTVACNVRASSTIKVKGGKVHPGPISGTFAAGQIAQVVLTPNSVALKELKADIGFARLQTKVTTTDTTTGAKDVDRRVFKFKK